MGLEPNQLRDALSDVIWQFNEAVSLLREARRSVMLPVLVHEIDDGLPAMQTALESLVVLSSELVSEPAHQDYDVALPEIDEWVNRSGQW